MATQASGLTIRDACYTLYDALGLAPAQIDILLSLGLERAAKPLSGGKRQLNSYHRFQERGLSFFNFVDDDSHSLRTTINAAFFAMTPERRLLAILNKASVIGLSATAMLPTVLDNYDLAYLKEMLAERLVDGTQYFSQPTIAALALHERYSEAGVAIHPEVCATGETFAEMLAQRLPTQKLDSLTVEQLDAELDKQIRQAQAATDDTDYMRRRYLALFESFVLFLSDRQMTSFLGLQMLLPRTNKAEMSEEYVQSVFSTLAELVVGGDDAPQLRIIAATNPGQVTEALQEVLKLPAEHATRVYLLSTYQTLGVGQNLQHTMSPQEQQVVLNVAPQDAAADDPRRQTVDLAGIYLGDVTHILSSDKQFTMTAQGLRMITELEYLFDAGELSMTALNARFKALQQSRPYRHPRASKSLVVSYSRTIIQALGRMNRSFNKMPHLRLLATGNVLANISRIGVDLNTVSPEYRCLLAYAHEQPRNIEATEAEVRQENLTWYTHMDVEELKQRLPTSIEAAKHYRYLRQFVLAHPTISRAELVAATEGDAWDASGLQYIEAPEGAATYTAQRHRKDDGHYEFGGGNMAVSAEASGMSAMCNYPGLAAELAHYGYPTEWQPAELIINPVQFINLYLGALGEFAGRWIVEHEWPEVHLAKFEQLENNELFDFKCADGVAVDFKNWRGRRDVSGDRERKRVQAKLRSLEKHTGHSWRVLIVNVVAAGDDQLKLSADGTILEVPGLIDAQGQLVLKPADKIQIGAFFIGQTTDSDHEAGL